MFTATKEQMKTVGLYQSLIPHFHQTLPVNPTLPPPPLFFGCPLLEMDHGVSRTPCLENVIRNFNEQGKVLAHVSYTARDGAGQKSI